MCYNPLRFILIVTNCATQRSQDAWFEEQKGVGIVVFVPNEPPGVPFFFLVFASTVGALALALDPLALALFLFFSLFPSFSSLFHLFLPFSPFFSLFLPFSPFFSLFLPFSFFPFSLTFSHVVLFLSFFRIFARLTLPSLTFPLLSEFFFSRGGGREVLAHQMGCSFQGLSRCSVADVRYKLSYQIFHVCELGVWSKRAPESVEFFFFGTWWFQKYNADVNGRR